MASTLKVDKLEGSTGSTVTVPTGQTLTLTDGLAVASLPVVTVAKGGTNIASFAAGDLLYATGSTTLAKLPKGAAEKVLSINSGASAPEWTDVDLTVLPTISVAKGGTNLTSFTAGDFLYATGSTTLAKLTASGHGSKTLKMNSGATAPEWVTVAASGGLTLDTDVWKHSWSDDFDTGSTSEVAATNGQLVLPAQSGTTKFLVMFTEMREEQNTNGTYGIHRYGTDGSTAGTFLGHTYYSFAGESPQYLNPMQHIAHGRYYVTFTDGQTPIFKLFGKMYTGSNTYRINQNAGENSLITATKI